MTKSSSNSSRKSFILQNSSSCDLGIAVEVWEPFIVTTSVVSLVQMMSSCSPVSRLKMVELSVMQCCKVIPSGVSTPLLSSLVMGVSAQDHLRNMMVRTAKRKADEDTFHVCTSLSSLTTHVSTSTAKGVLNVQLIHQNVTNQFATCMHIIQGWGNQHFNSQAAYVIVVLV